LSQKITVPSYDEIQGRVLEGIETDELGEIDQAFRRLLEALEEDQEAPSRVVA
jgi:hypothetical protein